MKSFDILLNLHKEEDEIERLKTELEIYKKDAERYRWLKKSSADNTKSHTCIASWGKISYYKFLNVGMIDDDIDKMIEDGVYCDKEIL